MIKYAWLNTETGEFSNSWTGDACRADLDVLTEYANKSHNLVLIKYEVVSKHSFELCDLMRLA